MNETELKINRIVQGVVSLNEGLAWYDESDLNLQNEIMRALDRCVSQAHPTKEDIEAGLKESGLKETYSPCVLVKNKPFNEVRQKILNMCEPDKRRGFVLLLSVFRVADKRRRESQCKDGCTHEWHNIRL
ncbi:DUF5958 family protein [Methylobacter sp.]|uniref:DUF5958 family protein n=1 Tax=Methylobacter sp. TaxID=2051955 RepID=UPI00122376E2|nr:DUF5958 family protein [Methylobacter sp.]TAK64946.1 MAG: hypothetical protein EPO18_01855 [Methylobacter sp.]